MAVMDFSRIRGKRFLNDTNSGFASLPYAYANKNIIYI